MLSSKCTHLRIRDNNDYDINVDRFIKLVEKEYKIDFRALPGWKYLVQRLHVAATDCKRKVQDAHLRKTQIIDKLYIQSTRPSPFELTAGLCRTEKKWRQMENERKKRETSKSLSNVIPVTDYEKEVGDFIQTPHPNTEILSSQSAYPELALEHELDPPKIDVEVQADPSTEPSHLPVFICTNHHKLLSSLGSQFSVLSYKSLLADMDESIKSVKEEWQYLKSTSSVICTPRTVTITNNSLKQQSVLFSVTNCADDYMHIRFKHVLDCSPFKKTKISPAIPKRLYPGVPVVFKFTFTLENQKEFKSALYFRVGRNVYENAPTEAFCVPITSAFIIQPSVMVSDTIMIAPVYPWHIKKDSMYSTGNIKISVNDPYTYHLHIHKRVVNLSSESDAMLSLQASGLNTESVIERSEDKEVDFKTIVSSVKSQNETQLINNNDIIALIVDDLIELALEAFIFETTYLCLNPYAKANIPVYFTKAEYIGCHQRYYDLDLVDPDTEQVMMTKTIKIFAEVLPHPIQIHPVILDMSESPISHGYCEDNFIITNSHKLYAATIKIKLTTKMRKMFYVEPMEAVVPTLSCVPFAVKFCSRDFLSVKPSEDLVHFTFKIVVTGYKDVYENVPPFFYEIIAPCAVEFKKVYNKKYFKED